ncbi:protein GUCD1 isoform X1 [Coffea eugenioides]|uniref:protein GUCD1 isoform X1 n=2 Tax=Coffea eugenioides TaxID=49369 RepID=UPI000F615674|nr:protein GUCD1 isoform X1 [Coffea eugenioides]
MKMWPLYLLFNKFLKAEEENNQGPPGTYLNLVESYPFKLLLSKERSKNDTLCHSGSVEVPHINQQYTWDCGLACVLMVLRTLGINSGDIQELEGLCCTTSIWTVDLAYLLQKFSVKFSYFTVTFGANPNFLGETFYKDQLPSDLLRVDMLFKKARDAGINIECRSINGEEIASMVLSGNYIVIALIDQYILSRSWIKDVCISGIYDDCPGYTGHYVIICGYDAATDEFEIRDPASSSKHERMTSRRLEEARKAFGTDEDLLLISLEKEQKGSNPFGSLFPHNC